LKNSIINERIFRYIFCVGYVMVLIEAFVLLNVDLHKMTLNVVNI
jgi:hypothetical protein